MDKPTEQSVSSKNAGAAQFAPRVLIVGLDGMTYDVMKPLADEGVMPTCKSLMERGSWGVLRSTVPPVTGPAWCSFSTGKQPGNHGVFDFFKPTPAKNKVGMSRRIINSREVDGKTLWQILSDAGRKSIVMNVPVSYPASTINGVILAGMLSPSIDRHFCKPENTVERLSRELGEYHITVNWQGYAATSARGFINDTIECEKQRTKYCLKLMEENPDWALCFPCFTEPDRIQHALWDYIDPKEREKLKAGGRFRPEVMDDVMRFYRELDHDIRQLLEKAGPETPVFFVSDHGFGPLYGKYMVNEFLVKKGLLVVNHQKIRLAMAGILGRKVWYKVLKTVGLNSVVKASTAKRAAARGSTSARTFYDVFYESIDWAKTKAYMASNTEGGLYLNVKGRRLYGNEVDRGCINPEDYAKVRQEVIEALRDIRHPETGKSMLSFVGVREEVYKGKYVERAPDIVFFLDDGEWIADFSLGKGMWKKADWRTGSGMHRMEGCFLACGPGIKANNKVHTDIFCVVPTVLGYLGMPIPTDMDGKFINEAFTDDWRGSHDIKYEGTSSQAGSGWGEGRDVFDEKEEEVLVERLRGLGYID